MGPVRQRLGQFLAPKVPLPPPSNSPTAPLTIERTLFHDALKGLICPFAFLLNPVTIIWESNGEKWVLLSPAGPPKLSKDPWEVGDGTNFSKALSPNLLSQ